MAKDTNLEILKAQTPGKASSWMTSPVVRGGNTALQGWRWSLESFSLGKPHHHFYHRHSAENQDCFTLGTVWFLLSFNFAGEKCWHHCEGTGARAGLLGLWHAITEEGRKRDEMAEMFPIDFWKCPFPSPPEARGAVGFLWESHCPPPLWPLTGCFGTGLPLPCAKGFHMPPVSQK